MTPAEMTHDCEICGGRRVVLPARACATCERDRFMARSAWEFCNRCGAVGGRHLPTCNRQEETPR